MILKLFEISNRHMGIRHANLLVVLGILAGFKFCIKLFASFDSMRNNIIGYFLI